MSAPQAVPGLPATARALRARVTAGHGRALVSSFGGSALVQVLGVVTGILLARGLGPAERGMFAAMVLWPTIMVALGDLGLVNSFAYFTARRGATAHRMFALARRTAGLQSLYLVPVTLGVAYVGLSHAGAEPLAAGLVLAAAFVPAALLSRFTAAVFQGRLQMTRFYAIRLSMYVVIAVGLVGAMATSGLTVWAAVGAYLAGLAAMAVVSLLLPRREPAVAAPGAAGGTAFTRGEFTRFGLRSLPGSMYPVETLFLDQVLVALFLGPEDLGLYVTAVAFTSLVRLVAYAIAATSMPAIAAAPADRQGRLTLRSVALAVAALAPVTALLVLAMPTVLPLVFGDAFSAAVDPARFLLLGSLAFGIRQVLGECTRGAGRPGIVSLVEMGSWPAIVAAAAVGTAYGLEGVTIALLVVQVLALAALVAARATGGPAAGAPAEAAA
jgi:O-antigen/teichoic acid export membrane protein